jgi:AraC family transcriptional regulator
MRRGEWPDSGKLEELTSACDSVLVWTGNAHEVTVHASSPGMGSTSRATSTTFVRRNGMIDLMPAGTQLHEVRWRGGSATCVAVNLASDTLRTLFGEKAPHVDPERPALFGVAEDHVVDLVQRLEQQMNSGEPLGAAYVQGLTLTLASYVFGPRDTLRPAPERRLHGLDVASIVAFIEENLGGNLGLLELASISGYSADHFSRQFKRAFRQSPYQYILGRRIERAKSLLRDPRLSIVDVALAAGFSSQAHLSAMFKRSTGVTPGKYRKG